MLPILTVAAAVAPSRPTIPAASSAYGAPARVNPSSPTAFAAPSFAAAAKRTPAKAAAA